MAFEAILLPGACYDYYNSSVAPRIPYVRDGSGPKKGRLVSEPFAGDFEVLKHLRGYPEELHRYANLMKQTHPRGMSAVEVLLGRGGAQDGVPGTICRVVKAGATVVPAVEAGERAAAPPREVREAGRAAPG